MAVVKINAIDVPEGAGPELEKRFAARAGAVVSYREIADALGRSESDFRNNALARHVSSLRRKLGDDPRHPRYVETVAGVGYRVLVTR